MRSEITNLFLRAYEDFVWEGSNILEKYLSMSGGWRGSVMRYLGVSGQIGSLAVQNLYSNDGSFVLQLNLLGEDG